MLSHHSIWPLLMCVCTTNVCVCVCVALTCRSSSWSPPSSRATATEAKGRLAICCLSLISCCRRHREKLRSVVNILLKIHVTSSPPRSDDTVLEVDNFARGHSSRESGMEQEQEEEQEEEQQQIKADW